MSQKIIRIGSSMGVTLPKRLLAKLGVSASDSVELSYNSRHNSIEIVPIKPPDSSSSQVLSDMKKIIEANASEFAKLED